MVHIGQLLWALGAAVAVCLAEWVCVISGLVALEVGRCGKEDTRRDSKPVLVLVYECLPAIGA